jgi:hypothetical protein
MTVSAMLSGDPIQVGMFVAGTSIAAGTYITSFGTGSGGIGTYNLSASSTQASATTMYSGLLAPLQDPSPMELGVGPLGRIYVWDCVPQALQAANIAASQTPAAAGALTLTAGTSAKSIVRSDGTTIIQLDCPRAVSIFLTTGGTARTYTVTGYDVYGQSMTEQITTVAAATTSGNKAFWQIVSVVGAGGGSTTAVTVGTTDKLGSAVRILDRGYVVHAGYNNTLADDAGTLTPAVTSTANATSGDVRGTFLPSSATDGTKRLVLTIALPAIAVGPNATRIGAFGVTQA